MHGKWKARLRGDKGRIVTDDLLRVRKSVRFALATRVARDEAAQEAREVRDLIGVVVR